MLSQRTSGRHGHGDGRSMLPADQNLGTGIEPDAFCLLLQVPNGYDVPHRTGICGCALLDLRICRHAPYPHQQYRIGQR